MVKSTVDDKCEVTDRECFHVTLAYLVMCVCQGVLVLVLFLTNNQSGLKSICFCSQLQRFKSIVLWFRFFLPEGSRIPWQKGRDRTELHLLHCSQEAVGSSTMGQGLSQTLQRHASSYPRPLSSPHLLQFHYLPTVNWLIESGPRNLIISESALTSIQRSALLTSQAQLILTKLTVKVSIILDIQMS